MTALSFVVIILVGVVSYLIGSINLSIIISKLMKKGDIRELGSKNAGTTNTLRVLGKGPALIVFIWDVLKGALAIGIARGVAQLVQSDMLGGASLGADYTYVYCFGIMIAAIAVILGHNFPAFFGFRGGKGVATSLGVILAIEWQIGLICLVAGVVGIAIFQFVSVGSLIAAIEYPILVCIIGGLIDPNFRSTVLIRVAYIAFSFILSLMVIYKHKANIERIKNGTENKLRFKKTKEEIIEEEKEQIQMTNDEKKEEVVEENKEEV